MRHVEASSFEVGLQEARCLDKAHSAESMGWMVVEAGSHDVTHEGASVLMQAGRLAVSEVERFDWYPVRWPVPYAAAPAVLTQINTFNDENPAWPRIQLLDSNGFEVSLQEDDFDGLHFVEENDEVLVAGLGRSGHAVGDLPGVRFKVVKVSSVGLYALYRRKKEKPRS